MNSNHETCDIASKARRPIVSLRLQLECIASGDSIPAPGLPLLVAKPQQPRNLPRMILLAQQWCTPIATKHLANCDVQGFKT